jgi:ABC-type multidrug transport system fused ATPase/permease subunit
VFDVTIPLIVLTLANYEAYVGTTNPAHGPVPLFLVLCLALLRFLPNTALRVALTLFVNFLLVYTGFGVFFGLVVFLLMLVDLAASVRAREGIVRHLVGAAGSAATLLLFFRWHYSFQPAVGCFVFPDPHPIRYGEYISTLYLRAFQLHDLAPRGALVGAGVLVTAASAAVLLWATWRTLRSWGSSRVHVVAFALSAFCLLFAANTAIGRVCLGVEQAASSRYVSYSLLSVLAMYYALQTAQLRPWLRTGLLSVLLVLCLVKESRSDHDLPVVRSYSEGKARWAACYLREENVSSCNQSAKFSVYPEGQETHLEEKLRYLKERHLNLFKGTR